MLLILNQLVGTRQSQRIAVDQLFWRRLLVWSCCEADQHPRHKFADRGRERLAIVAVVLVRKDDEVFLFLEVIVKSLAESLLELAGLATRLGIGLKQRLNREDKEFYLRVVVHRRSHHRRSEVFGGNYDGLDFHAAQKTLGMPRREVIDGLAENRLAGCDHSEVAHALGREVVNRSGPYLWFTHCGGEADHTLARRLASVNVVLLTNPPGHRVPRPTLGGAQIQPSSHRLDRVGIDQRVRNAHQPAASTGGFFAREP